MAEAICGLLIGCSFAVTASPAQAREGPSHAQSMGAENPMLAVALTPLAIARDSLDVVLRPASLPMWIFPLDHTTFFLACWTPFPWIAMAHSGLTTSGTRDGWWGGVVHILQPFDSGFALFPNLRTLWW